jgi:hypothetical protein
LPFPVLPTSILRPFPVFFALRKLLFLRAFLSPHWLLPSVPATALALACGEVPCRCGGFGAILDERELLVPLSIASGGRQPGLESYLRVVIDRYSICITWLQRVSSWECSRLGLRQVRCGRRGDRKVCRSCFKGASYPDDTLFGLFFSSYNTLSLVGGNVSVWHHRVIISLALLDVVSHDPTFEVHVPGKPRLLSS